MNTINQKIDGEIEIEVVNFLKSKLIISEEYLIYKKKKIFFQDVEKIKCKAIKHYSNYGGAVAYFGIFYNISLIDKNDNKVSIEFASKDENYHCYFNLIVDKIIFKLAPKLIDFIKNNGQIEIGKLLLNQEGLHKKRLLLKSVLLSWENCSNCELKHGYMVVYDKFNNEFCKIDSSVYNAISLPLIINAMKHNGIVEPVNEINSFDRNSYMAEADL